MDRTALDAAHAAAVMFLEGVSSRPVGATADAASMRDALGGPQPEQGEPAARVVEDLARKADPGLVATAGPRFFGFVIGGSVPASLGADWLTSAWDQNAGLFVLSPAAAIVEETVLEWLTALFAGEEAHVTVHGALRLLGLGDESVVTVPSDAQGRMIPEALEAALGAAS